MALDVYYGEFTVHPVPLELSLNYCSYGCSYCFANLNHPERDANVGETMALLAGFGHRKGIDALLLREGYPVLISNRTDAFAHSNVKQALPLIQVMADMGIPMAFQTKGGAAIDEILPILKPSAWYISIAFIEDSMRKQIEPGAPSLAHRYDLIHKLTTAGHTVYLGLNPLVPEWVADGKGHPRPDILLQRAKDAGAVGTWIELLHLNRNQVEAMTPKERAAIGEDTIARAKGPLASDEDAVRTEAFAIAKDIGMTTYCLRQTYRSDFWAPYRQLYPRTFPTHQDFINWCHDNKQEGDAVTYEDYCHVMLSPLPTGEHRIENYIRVPNRALYMPNEGSPKGTPIPAVMTYERLLRYAWNEPRLWFAPVRMGNFAYAAAFDAHDEPTCWTDEDDNALMIWDPNGNLNDCLYIEAEPELESAIEVG